MARLGLAAATALALAAGAPAFAQDAGDEANASSISGSWKLETGMFDGSCYIEGQMTLVPSALPGGYVCTFVTTQICTDPDNRLSMKVQQSCTAQRVGDGVAITSRVNKVLERNPPYPEWVVPENQYYADNFLVRVTKKGAEMVGTHYDKIRKVSVRFWRDVALVS